MLATTKSISPEDTFRRLGLERSVFTNDACSALAEKLIQVHATRVLVVRDPVATDACGISGALNACVKNHQASAFFDVTATLSPSQVDRFAKLCREGQYDSIVAVGGGATLDAAKLIALGASSTRPLKELLAQGFTANKIPIIALPTTAGSGSEATHFAVLFVDQEKFSVAHPTLRPTWAIVDPTLTHSSPRKVAAAAGLDVLCQAIESLWSVNADQQSISHASEALRLVVPSLRSAVVESDAEAQKVLALASHLAGQAINRGFTTICHAMSYMLTAKYGVPHGFAAAATLPASLLYNTSEATTDANSNVESEAMHADDLTKARECAARAVPIVLDAFQCKDIEAAAIALVRLIRSVGGAASVSELELPHDYRPIDHAESIDPHRLLNNPRPVAIEDSLRLLLATFDVDGRIAS